MTGGMARAALAAAVAAAAVGAAAGTCIHDALTDALHEGVPHEERHLRNVAPQVYNYTVNEHGRALQATFSNIRIRVDTSRLLDGG